MNGDLSVQMAREMLARFDRGGWTHDPVGMAGELAAALRILLQYVDGPGGGK